MQHNDATATCTDHPLAVNRDTRLPALRIGIVYVEPRYTET